VRLIVVGHLFRRSAQAISEGDLPGKYVWALTTKVLGDGPSAVACPDLAAELRILSF